MEGRGDVMNSVALVRGLRKAFSLALVANVVVRVPGATSAARAPFPASRARVATSTPPTPRPEATMSPTIASWILAGPLEGIAEAATPGLPAVEIAPGQNVQEIVAAAPPGTTFLLKTGVHRVQSIRPRDGDTITGEAGAVLSGARLLTAFTRSGGYWVASGQTQQGAHHGQCQAGYSRCGVPEQLFIDDRLLLLVGSPSEIVPGTWYFDYAGDRIVFADDPTGHRVETSVSTTAIEATANHVTVSGLTIEKYANLAQNGVVTADGTTGWDISRNEVRWNHGLGIRIGTDMRVTANHVHHNGQLGIGGAGSGVLVEANEIAYNNTAHFDPSWEAGGAKFVLTDGLTVRENNVHHNSGPGLWTDIDNINTTYEGNTVEDNERMGIFHEISYAAVIRHNIVRRNGFGFPTWMWGAGILVAASPDVEVYGNTVEGNADGIGAIQQKRGAGVHGPHETSNLWVHDNTVTMTQGWTGLVQDVGDSSYFSSRDNRFDRNRYQLGRGATFFTWKDAECSEAQWKDYGEDVVGTFSR
jgi:parallel beta-helix repeat protein